MIWCYNCYFIVLGKSNSYKGFNVVNEGVVNVCNKNEVLNISKYLKNSSISKSTPIIESTKDLTDHILFHDVSFT